MHVWLIFVIKILQAFACVYRQYVTFIGFITMRFDAEGSLNSGNDADMESCSDSTSDSQSREKVLVTELKQHTPIHGERKPDLMHLMNGE